MKPPRGVRSGPLSGVRIIEFAGIGPAPFAGMMLADMGAEIVRIDRTQPARRPPRADLMNRGRRSVALDLKSAEGVAAAARLIESADALIEGFRPGVMERLGLGPEQCLERNPRLVYGRMTGWGQEGPLAAAAGHDINYIALAGALAGIGRKDGKPVPPLNLVGDFGGGGMYLAFGVVCALLEAQRSGRGQVVDAAMVDGVASLLTMFYGLREVGAWSDVRGTNFLDGAAPYYDVYETADGEHVAIGSIEPQFYAELLQRIGLAETQLPSREDRAQWALLKQRLAAVFKTRTRAEWCTLLEGSDACFAPVLTMAEAPQHPHNRARGTFVEANGILQPGPAPRFSRTPGAIDRPPPLPGEHTREVLVEAGYAADEIAALLAKGTAAQA
jgi:alpha-methylacyl-CoA racemase